MTKKLLPTAIIIAGVLIAGALIYNNYQNQEELIGLNEGETLSSQEVAAKAIDFINKNLLRGQATASLKEALGESGVYKIKFNLGEREIESYITVDGKVLFLEGINLAEAQMPAEEVNTTIGNFSVSNDEVCQENGKPIVYFFGSTSCSHCAWEHPIVEEVVKNFEGYISFHNNMDSENDMDIFRKYSTGGIPTLVFGCKYYRVGAGTQSGEEKEIGYLTALICKLTDGKPNGACSQVQDLINQIE